jgi:hypothetical protein
MRISNKLILVVTIVSLSGNVWLISRLMDQMKERPYFSSDIEFIEESIRLYSEELGVSADEAMRNRFPVVAVSGSGRCVNLQLKRGMLGFVPVFCFDDEGAVVTRKLV